jgi:hypothetical protein
MKFLLLISDSSGSLESKDADITGALLTGTLKGEDCSVGISSP